MMKVQTSSTVQHRAPMRVRRVLVVDDNRDAADTLGAMLTFLGYDVRVAYDSETALQEATWFEPDVAVWDISLPGVNGYEAARRLRALRDGKRVMLVALTAHATAADRSAALAAGFDLHMKKPVDVNALLTEIGCA
jgi:CheY-like chemotaxis protein